MTIAVNLLTIAVYTLGFLALAVALEHWIGNNGLWCALVCFMVLRAITLALRLPGIEKSFVVPVPVS